MRPLTAWPVLAPSALAFADGYAVPEVLTEEGIRAVVAAFAAASRRACEAGFRVARIDIDRRTGTISLFAETGQPSEPRDEIADWLEHDERRSEGSASR